MTTTDPAPEPTAVDDLPTADAIARLLTADIPEVPTDLDPAVPFDEADIDSLVLAEVAVVATRRYGVVVQEWELRDAGTMLAAAALVRERAGGRTARS